MVNRIAQYIKSSKLLQSGKKITLLFTYFSGIFTVCEHIIKKLELVNRTKVKKIALITRCRNEPYVNEFVNHYLNEGIDDIFIIDDHSKKGQYKDVNKNQRVKIIKDIPFINGPELNLLYQKISKYYEWVVCVDMDEYITTKKNPEKTLREEINTTFKDVDCVKIPWVMMAFNKKKKNPLCLLESNYYRWNHDKTHISKSQKLKVKCGYDLIEVKCIYKTKSFDQCWWHGPYRENIWRKGSLLRFLKGTRIVDGIYNNKTTSDIYYHALREKDIANAFLLCFHFRLKSQEDCKQRIEDSALYHKYTLKELESCDYPEVYEDTLYLKSTLRKRRS